MILLNLPRISLAESDLDTILKSGEKAQFSGVLVPEDLYRFYRIKEEQASELETSLIECNVKEDKRPVFGPMSMALVGTLIGAGLVYAIKDHDQGTNTTAALLGGAGIGGLLVLSFQ